MDAVEQLLTEAVGRVFPAAQLVVLDGGRVVLERAVGNCAPETLFDIASLTKPLATVTLVMRLLERGRLSLDDEPRPGVTLRLLLCHASGLPAWRLLGATRDEILARVKAEPLERAPGTASVYSDLGFILLGDAVERAGGARLDELITREVPLPIRYGPIEPALCAETEHGLRGVVHDENARALGGVAGHAGLFANARAVAEMARSLVETWHGAAGLVAPETLRRFWSPCPVAGSTWCLGWDRPSAVGSSAGARWPRDGVGHLGFTGCSLWIDPPRRRAVVLLSNRVNPTRENDRIKAFRPLLHDAIVESLDGK
jgi:CubicO group peptidase (beta-lactamase class C family)